MTAFNAIALSNIRAKFHWSFLLAGAIAVTAIIGEPYISAILSLKLWQKLRLLNFPYKVSLFLPPIAIALWIAVHFSLKAKNFRRFLLVLTIIGMQTNGVKILPGIDLITILPFFVFFYIMAEALRDPSNRIELRGVMFFAMLLLLLDLPYMAVLHYYGPPRFIINFISAFKAFWIAFIIINLIRTADDFRLALKAMMIVAVISATIGVGQVVLNHYTGITFSLLAEEHETKPTFFGTVLRSSGLTSWPSWLSDFLVLSLPFFLFELVKSRNLWMFLLYALCIGLMGGAIFLSYTYAAWAAVAVMAAIFPFLRWPRQIPMFITTILFVAAFFWALDIVFHAGIYEWLYRHFEQKIILSKGMIEREVYLQAAIDHLTQDPWLGSGFYAEEEFSENFYRKRIHNTGVQVWADLGLPGLIVFLVLILTVTTQMWLLAGCRKGRKREIFQALGLGMIGMIVEMFAEPNLTTPVTWYFLGLCQTAVMVWNSPNQDQDGESVRSAEVHKST